MSERQETSRDGAGYDSERHAAQNREVLLVPYDSVIQATSESFSLAELWRVIWSGRWLVILMSGLFGIAAIAYALLATEYYRADVLLAPAEQTGSPAIGPDLGRLGGLASLAGIRVDS